MNEIRRNTEKEKELVTAKFKMPLITIIMYGVFFLYFKIKKAPCRSIMCFIGIRIDYKIGCRALQGSLIYLYRYNYNFVGVLYIIDKNLSI